jgi:cell shape-determining protein MreC
VLSTTPNTATVQLLTDDAGQNAFAAGAKLATDAIGLVQTEPGGHVRLALPASSSPTVQRGQPVFTSGLGVLPPDLLIGYVDSPVGSNTGSVLNTFEITPAVSFQQLSVVHVVLYPVGVDRSPSAP